MLAVEEAKAEAQLNWGGLWRRRRNYTSSLSWPLCADSRAQPWAASPAQASARLAARGAWSCSSGKLTGCGRVRRWGLPLLPQHRQLLPVLCLPQLAQQLPLVWALGDWRKESCLLLYQTLGSFLSSQVLSPTVTSTAVFIGTPPHPPPPPPKQKMVPLLPPGLLN